MRKKADTDMLVPALIDTEISKKAFRKNWSRHDSGDSNRPYEDEYSQVTDYAE
jgi:hypothetical protein